MTLSVWRIEDATEYSLVTAEDSQAATEVFLTANGTRSPGEYYRRTGVDLQTMTVLRLTPKGVRLLKWSDPDLPQVSNLQDLLNTCPELLDTPSYIGSRTW